MKVKDILKVKGSKVYTVDENSTLAEATGKFFANKIGSLLAVNGANEVVGIIAPNDILKAVHEGCVENCSLQKVKDVMTRNILCASEEDSVEYLQALMSENRVRHIPIFDKKEIKGLVSIGDVVGIQIKEHKVENRYLKDYIEGKYPG